MKEDGGEEEEPGANEYLDTETEKEDGGWAEWEKEKAEWEKEVVILRKAKAEWEKASKMERLYEEHLREEHLREELYEKAKSTFAACCRKSGTTRVTPTSAFCAGLRGGE